MLIDRIIHSPILNRAAGRILPYLLRFHRWIDPAGARRAESLTNQAIDKVRRAGK